MPRPAEILVAAGRSPEAQAQRALEEVLAWADEWGSSGRKGTAEPFWERVYLPDGSQTVRIVQPRAEIAPRLPERTERALCAIAGSRRRAVQRMLDCEGEPERYARFRREFIAAWRDA